VAFRHFPSSPPALLDTLQTELDLNNVLRLNVLVEDSIECAIIPTTMSPLSERPHADTRPIQSNTTRNAEFPEEAEAVSTIIASEAMENSIEASNNTPEGTPVTPAQTPVDDHHSLPNPTITISFQATDYTDVTARCLLEGTLGQTAPNEHARQLSVVGTTPPPRLLVAANDYMDYVKSTAIPPPSLSK
jgi:hypothetical protein